jgi:predicted transglutaminase-like cysteine proteinase
MHEVNVWLALQDRLQHCSSCCTSAGLLLLLSVKPVHSRPARFEQSCHRYVLICAASMQKNSWARLRADAASPLQYMSSQVPESPASANKLKRFFEMLTYRR